MLSHRLYRKLLLRTLVFVVAALGLLVAANEYLLRQQLERALDASARTLMQQTAAQAARLSLAGDTLGMHVLLSELARNPDIASARIYGIDRQLLVSSGTAPDNMADGASPARREALLVYAEPVAYDDVVAGHLRVAWHSSAIERPVARVRAGLLAAAVVILFAAMFLAHRFGRRIARDLVPIRRNLQAQLDGHLEDSGDDDELARVARAAARFAGDAPAGADGDAAEPAPDAPAPDQFAVLAMEPVDLRGLLERFEVEQINGTLRRSYDLVRKCGTLYRARPCIIEHNRVLMLFAVPGSAETAIFRATCCARLFLQMVEKMRAERTERNSPPVHFRALVHAADPGLPGADATAAAAAADDSPVLGMTARLLAEARPDEVLLTSSCIDHALVLEKVYLGDARPAPVRGSRESMQLYPAHGLTAGQQVLLNRQMETLLYSANTY